MLLMRLSNQRNAKAIKNASGDPSEDGSASEIRYHGLVLLLALMNNAEKSCIRNSDTLEVAMFAFPRVLVEFPRKQDGELTEDQHRFL